MHGNISCPGQLLGSWPDIDSAIRQQGSDHGAVSIIETQSLCGGKPSRAADRSPEFLHVKVEGLGAEVLPRRVRRRTIPCLGRRGLHDKRAFVQDEVKLAVSIESASVFHIQLHGPIPIAFEVRWKDRLFQPYLQRLPILGHFTPVHTLETKRPLASMAGTHFVAYGNTAE